MNPIRSLSVACCLIFGATALADDQWLTIKGGDGPGKGKRIVLISGDEEYRSEETLPQMAKILAKHHGFDCTVLFAIDNDGTINPKRNDNIPGLEKLEDADLMVMFLRFRNLPDAQMKRIMDYVEAGKPMIALRTSTHPFNIPKGKTYSKYSFNSNEKGFEGGFGRQFFGETWVAHHGAHNKEGTRGRIPDSAKDHPILKGIKDGDIFGTTDVYTVRLPKDCVPLVMGEVTETLEPTSKAVTGKKNDPMMPVSWTKSYQTDSGKTGRVFTTTMGASQDFATAGTRRMLINASYWALGMESKIPAESKVDIVGEYKPTPFKFDGHKKGVKPSDLADK